MSKNKKADIELKRKIKEMEDKARAEAMSNSSYTVIKEEKQEEAQLSYDQWWMIAQSRAKMRPHMKEIIWAEMKSRGLSKNETMSKYDKALRLFGYSW